MNATDGIDPYKMKRLAEYVNGVCDGVYDVRSPAVQNYIDNLKRITARLAPVWHKVNLNERQADQAD